jgi:glycerol-3-phosphate acyltransferase PlsX
MLVQFGVMGSTYARIMLELESPRVGVLANGSEDSKGTDLTRAAVQLLRQTTLNCRGYCEGYELFLEGIDVCVCDGFVGNIVLKTSESLGKAIGSMLKEELRANPLRMLGALLAKGGLDRIRQRMNPETYGGAPLLGLNGYVIKVHGGARRTALRWAMRQAQRLSDLRVNSTIAEAIAAATVVTESAPSRPSAGTSALSS